MARYKFWCPHCEVMTEDSLGMGEDGEMRMCTECGHLGQVKEISGTGLKVTGDKLL